MFFSSWVAGRPATSNPTGSATGLFYTNSKIVTHVQDIEDEAYDESPAVSVIMQHEVRQAVEMLCEDEGELAPALAIVDDEGALYIWWPYGRKMAHEEVPATQRWEDAIRSGLLDKVSLPQLCPAARIIAAHQNIFVVQHQHKLYTSVWTTSALHAGIFLEDVKDHGVCFSPVNGWLAVATRNDCRDTVTVYNVTPTNQRPRPNAPSIRLHTISRWMVPRTSRRSHCGDIQTMKWSPDDQLLALADTSLTYAVMIYRVIGGSLIRSITSTMVDYTAVGSLFFEESDTGAAAIEENPADVDGLGVRGIEWAPTDFDDTAQLMLAVYDGRSQVRIYEEKSAFMGITSLLHHDRVLGGSHHVTKQITLYREALTSGNIHYHATIMGPSERVAFTAAPPPAKELDAKDARFSPPNTVEMLAFSKSRQIISTVYSSAPNTVWIWAMHPKSSSYRLLVALEHRSSVTWMEWSPTHEIISISCGGPTLFFWGHQGAAAVPLPAPELGTSIDAPKKASKFRWSPSGMSILVISNRPATLATSTARPHKTLTTEASSSFCVCFVPEETTLKM